MSKLSIRHGKPRNSNTISTIIPQFIWDIAASCILNQSYRWRHEAEPQNRLHAITSLDSKTQRHFFTGFVRRIFASFIITIFLGTFSEETALRKWKKYNDIFANEPMKRMKLVHAFGDVSLLCLGMMLPDDIVPENYSSSNSIGDSRSKAIARNHGPWSQNRSLGLSYNNVSLLVST